MQILAGMRPKIHIKGRLISAHSLSFLDVAGEERVQGEKHGGGSKFATF